MDEAKWQRWLESGMKEPWEEFESNLPPGYDIIKKHRLSASVGDPIGPTIRRELGYIDYSRAKEAIEYYRDLIRHKEVENAIVIDKNGKVTHFEGTYKTVQIYDVDLDGAYILHNHPEVNGILSFGEDDFIIIRENQSAYFDLCNAKYDYSCRVIKDMSKITYNQALRGSLEKCRENPEEDQQHLVMEYLKELGYVEYERREK